MNAKAMAAHHFEVVPRWLAVLAAEVCDLTGRTPDDVLADTYAAALTVFFSDAVDDGRAAPRDALKALGELDNCEKKESSNDSKQR